MSKQNHFKFIKAIAAIAFPFDFSGNAQTNIRFWFEKQALSKLVLILKYFMASISVEQDPIQFIGGSCRTVSNDKTNTFLLFATGMNEYFH